VWANDDRGCALLCSCRLLHGSNVSSYSAANRSFEYENTKEMSIKNMITENRVRSNASLFNEAVIISLICNARTKIIPASKLVNVLYPTRILNTEKQ